MSFSKLLLSIFFSLSVTFLNGQDRQHIVDSLKTLYKEAELDTAKASVLIMLGDLYYSSDPDSAFIFLDSGMEIARKSENKDLIARCLLIMGSAYWAKDDKFEALEHYLLAKEKYEELEDEIGLTRCFMNIGYLNHEQGNYNEAMEYTKKGLGLAESMEKKDDIRIAGFYQNLGLFSEKNEYYPQALEYYFSSLKIKEETNRIDVKRSLPKTLDGIAGVYNFMEQYDSALEFYKRALEIRKELDDRRGVFSSTYNIGVVYQGLGKNEAAREYYYEALNIAEVLSFSGGFAYCYDALGDLEKKEGNYSIAVDYIHKSLDIRKRKRNSKTYTHTLINLSGAYRDWGKPHQALKYAEEFEGFAASATLEDHVEILKIQSKIWENRNRYKKSLNFLKIANTLGDSLAKIAQKNILEIAKAKNERELKQLNFEKKILKQETEIQSIEVKSKNKLITVLSFGLALIFILLTLLYKAGLQRKKNSIKLAENNIELNTYNDKLKNVNTELSSLNKQLGVTNNSLKQFTFAASHDLKESLRSVISFSQILVKKIKKEEENDDLRTGVGFIVESGKRMHKTLDDLLKYSDLNTEKTTREKLGFIKIIKDIEKQMFTNNSVEFEWFYDEKIDGVMGHPQLISQLIFNIMDNAMKFTAEERPLKILATGQRIEDKGYLFSFKDNGVGIESKYLDYIFEPFKRLNNRDLSGSGLGLSVCKKIVEIHGGKIWAESIYGEGTTIFFTLNSKQK